MRANIRPGERKVWYVCLDCKVRYFNETGRPHAHVPYRDKASQHWSRPIYRYRNLPVGPKRYVLQKQEQEEAAEESGDEEPGEPVNGDDDEEANKKGGAFQRRGYVPKNIRDKPEERPTLEQYQERWREGLNKYSRQVPGDFGSDNLVPKPVPDRTVE